MLIFEQGVCEWRVRKYGERHPTAETHRASIWRKLNVYSVASLVRYAIRNKIIEP